MGYGRSFKFLSRRSGNAWGQSGLLAASFCLLAGCSFSLPSAVAKAEDCLSALDTAGCTGWKIGPNKVETSAAHTKRCTVLQNSSLRHHPPPPRLPSPFQFPHKSVISSVKGVKCCVHLGPSPCPILKGVRLPSELWVPYGHCIHNSWCCAADETEEQPTTMAEPGQRFNQNQKVAADHRHERLI